MEISKNKIVSFNYVLKNKAGKLLESSQTPVIYLHGYQHILPLLEQAFTGCKKGDIFSVEIPFIHGYGKRDERLIRTFARDKFAADVELQVGQQVYAPSQQNLLMKISKIEGDQITIDANHPLAGVDLVFEVTIVDVQEASPEEIAHILRPQS